MTAMRRTLDLPLRALQLDEGWDQGLDRSVVERIADSLKRGWMVPPVAVSAHDEAKYRLLWGRHRVAATMLAGAKTVYAEVHHHQNEDEARAQTLAENLHRQNIAGRDRDLAIAELVDVLSRVPRREPGEILPEQGAKPGKRKTAKGEAREQVASMLGTSKKAVERAEERVREAEALSSVPESRVALAFGSDVPNGDKLSIPQLESARAVREGAEDCAKFIASARRRIGSIPTTRESGLPMHVLLTLAEELDKLHKATLALCPGAVCAACRGSGVGGNKKPCVCNGRGWRCDGELMTVSPWRQLPLALEPRQQPQVATQDGSGGDVPDVTDDDIPF